MLSLASSETFQLPGTNGECPECQHFFVDRRCACTKASELLYLPGESEEAISVPAEEETLLRTIPQKKRRILPAFLFVDKDLDAKAEAIRLKCMLLIVILEFLRPELVLQMFVRCSPTAVCHVFKGANLTA